MSSALSLMNCLRVDDRTCWLRIEPLQALTLPYSEAFALATLLEVYGGNVRLGGQVLWARDIAGPLKAAVEADAGRPYVDVMTEQLWSKAAAAAPLVARYVASSGYRDIAGFTVPAGLRPNAAGLYAGQRWWTSEAERNAARGRVSEELEAWSYQSYAHEEEGGPPPNLTRPVATLVIEATRPEWLQHMRPGMTWAGYSFDDDAPSFP